MAFRNRCMAAGGLILLSIMGLARLGSAITPWEIASGWTLEADAWLAGQSKFDEQPGPQAAGHVWGKFDTNMLTLSLAKELPWRFQLACSFSRLSILPNTMYLHSEEVSTRFDGEGTQLLPQLNYHLPVPLWVQLDLGLGYQQVWAVKHFRDYQEQGIVLRPGNWGDYKIEYSGLVYLLSAKVPLPLGISLGGEIMGSPVLTNKTEVTGWGSVISEEAQGLRFRWKGYAAYSPLPLISVALGYRYEDIYFKEPKPDSFSLAIVYGGPFFDFSFQF